MDKDCCSRSMCRAGHLEDKTLVSPLPQPKQPFMRPNEDGMALLALDIGVQGRCHGGFRCLALALDEPPLQSYLGNVTCAVTTLLA